MFTNPKTLEEVLSNALETKQAIDRTIVVKHLGPPQSVTVRNGDKATLHDFWGGWGGYQDADGSRISKAEAQEEVNWLNKGEL